MLNSKKFWAPAAVASLAVILLAFTFVPASGQGGRRARVQCVVDMLVETQSGASVSTVPYHAEFQLDEGEVFSDDFSTATRFKFFDAALSKVNNDWVMSIDWFADTTVFNSVDFRTDVILPNGQKSSLSSGSHTFFNSTSSTKTTFSIVCTRN